MSGTFYNVTLKIPFPSFCSSAIEITRRWIYLIGTRTHFSKKQEKVINALDKNQVKISGSKQALEEKILVEEGVEIYILFTIKLRYYDC